ncbi:alpha/beta fold hydrolase [Streptomyces sp. NPDC058637]|uniref:alpha/beta fold hydrolase n=1 Tax=Streptomyces sp. NPDC058637 TaxID=3346569 RepID=UPI00364C5630
MPTFRTYDGTELAYHLAGEGRPLICLPGGPMRAARYLGDLGGLSRTHRSVLLDLRGTGGLRGPGRPVDVPLRPARRRTSRPRAYTSASNRSICSATCVPQPGRAPRRDALSTTAHPHPRHPEHPPHHAPDPAARERPGEITAPTLVVGGARSHLDQEQPAWMARHTPGGQYVRADAGHLVRGDDPDAFLAALKAFGVG